jgi:hypothetical protein
MDMKKAREEEVLMAPESGGVRHVAGKTFYETPDGWVDADFQEDMEVVEVEFLSDYYFHLIDNAPELARYFALGESVTVVHDGTAYRVTV